MLINISAENQHVSVAIVSMLACKTISGLCLKSSFSWFNPPSTTLTWLTLSSPTVQIKYVRYSVLVGELCRC